MAAKHVLSVIMIAGAVAATGGMTQRAMGQVVLNMPPPPPQTRPVAPPARASVDVGDVALYRYSVTRFSPQPTGPRLYQQYTRFDLFSPYHFHTYGGKRFLPPPMIFDFRRPFPMRGFRFELQKD